MKRSVGVLFNRRALLPALILFFLAGAALSVSYGKGKAPGTDAPHHQLLSNPGLEMRPDGGGPVDWQLKNGELGRISPAGPGTGTARRITLESGSAPGRTFVLFQQLAPEALRGKELLYGGDVRTNGARVYLRLWSPEGNSEAEIRDSKEFKTIRKRFRIPQDASGVFFAVEVVGPKGAEAWVDNLFAGGEAPVKEASRKAAAQDETTRPNIIRVDPFRRLGPVSRLKFGSFIEWIGGGNGIYDTRRMKFNREVVDLLKPLGIPVWRFPGGVFSDYYDWRKGVGDPNRRPLMKNPFDPKKKEVDVFGTDEFIEFLKMTGSEPLITANYGTGTKEMAVSWLRHFRDKGMKARYWEIGNEIYMADPDDPVNPNGSLIYHSAEQYARDFPEWADALKEVDPKVKVGAIGGITNTHKTNRDWLDVVLEKAGSRIDFIALHNAFAPIIPGRFDYESGENRLRAYRVMLASIEVFKEDVAMVKAKVRKYAPGRRSGIPLAITEHYPIFGMDWAEKDRKQFVQNVDQTRTLASAIYTAGILTAIVNDPQIFMANYLNPIHRYYGAFLSDSEEGIIKNPVYYVYQMYRNNFGTELLWSEFTGGTFSTEPLGMVREVRDAPVLEAAAAADKGGVVTIAVVNKDVERSQDVEIRVKGADAPMGGVAYILEGKWANAVAAPPFSESTRRQHDIGIRRIKVSGAGAPVVSLPPLSFSIIRLSAAGKR